MPFELSTTWQRSSWYYLKGKIFSCQVDGCLNLSQEVIESLTTKSGSQRFGSRSHVEFGTMSSSRRGGRTYFMNGA